MRQWLLTPTAIWGIGDADINYTTIDSPPQTKVTDVNLKFLNTKRNSTSFFCGVYEKY